MTTQNKKRGTMRAMKYAAATVFMVAMLVSAVPILFGVFVFQDELSAPTPSSSHTEQLHIALNDVAPGAMVSFDILDGDSVVASGNKNIDLSGHLALPTPASVPPAQEVNETVGYKLQIKGPMNSSTPSQEPLNLFLQVHKKTGEIHFNGSGLDHFSDFIFARGPKKEEFKTDWSGSFAEKIPSTGDPENVTPAFKLAFQNFNIAGDLSSSQNPAIVQAQSTSFSCVPAANCTTLAHPCPAGQVWCRLRIPDPMDPIFSFIYVNRCDSDPVCFSGSPVWSGGTNQGPWCPTGTVPCDITQPPSTPGGTSTTAACGINWTPSLFGNANPPTLIDVQRCWSVSLFMMTHQLTAVMGSQISMIGSFLDAKHQLELQRRTQELQARAHKDYHPSEQICRIGSFVKSLAHAEEKLEMEKHALNRILMDQYLGVLNNHGAHGSKAGPETMRNLYLTRYCDRRDNNNSLDRICTTGTTVAERERLNKDIDYVRTFDRKLTLDIDFLDAVSSADEEDIVALAQHLYFSQMFEQPDSALPAKIPERHYQSRSYASKLNVAHNSFINIVGMKSNAPLGAGPDAGWNYMKSLLREFGFTGDPEIHAYLGDRPSYYAQMEVLTKKLFQHPNFYTNLYDKPVNVDRMGVALDAISLMNQRDRFDSMLRREMLTSMLIEESLGDLEEDLSVRMYKSMRSND